MSDTSVNPNVPVGGESQAQSKANSAVSWDDVSEVTETKPERSKSKKDDDEKPAKSQPKAKKESSAFDEVDEAPAPKRKEPSDNPKGDDDEAPKERKDAKDAKDKDGDKDQQKPAKAKTHKFRAGENAYDLSGDAVVSIPVDGKKEDVPLQELINNYNGQVVWNRRFQELDRQEKEHIKSRDGLNKMVTDLHEKASKDPETAWDFLAEWTGQDPIALKEKILRQQIQEILPLAQMNHDELESYIKDQVRNWRDRQWDNRTKADQRQKEEAKAESERNQAMQQYGMDDRSYDRAHRMAQNYFKRQNPDFNGKVTPQQVVIADRNLMALEVIQETVPHLENDKNFGSIVDDIVSDLVRHPSMTREKLAKLLGEVYGDDNQRLKNLGRKAAKTAEVSDDEGLVPSSRTRQQSNATFFDDL